MGLPTRDNIITLDFPKSGQSWCRVPAKSDIDPQTLDWAYWGQPWGANPWGGVGPWIIQPEGIPSAEALGNPVIIPGAVIIQPAGIPSGEAFGEPTIVSGLLIIQPSGIPSAEAFASPVVIPGAVIIQPSGIASAEALGEPTISSIVIIIPQGISSGEAFGTPQVLPGLVTIRPEGIASLEAFGIPALAIPTAARPLELQVALQELRATVILLPAPEVETLLRAAKAQVKLDG